MDDDPLAGAKGIMLWSTVMLVVVGAVTWLLW